MASKYFIAGLCIIIAIITIIAVVLYPYMSDISHVTTNSTSNTGLAHLNNNSFTNSSNNGFNNTTMLENNSIYHFSRAYKPFTDADFYVDPVSRIVLTAQKGLGRNGFGVDIRGLEDDGVWKSEFFCEPDTVIFCYNDNEYLQAYLSYLVWTDDAYVSDNQVILSMVHMSHFGDQEDLLPNGATVNIDELPLDIMVTHSHYLASDYVKTDVSIRNRGTENMTITYVYQDAAYLWFPRNNQEGIVPVYYQETDNSSFFNTSIYTSHEVSDGERVFAGYADRDHGVVAGVYSESNGSRIGLIKNYIGLENKGMTDGTSNYQLMLKKRTYFYDVPGNNNDSYLSPDYSIKSRFVAFEIKDVMPGETRNVTYYRIMHYSGDQVIDDDDIFNYIVNGISEISQVTSPPYGLHGLPGTGIRYADG